MGGIEIDAQARVIGRDGEPIPGLFAAGSCTGGVEGGPLGGYIGGYLKAGCPSPIAGRGLGAMARMGGGWTCCWPTETSEPPLQSPLSTTGSRAPIPA